MTTTALPDVFRAAADVIGERGWIRGVDISPDSGAVCANGALRVACGSSVDMDEQGLFHLDSPDNLVARTVQAAHRVLDDRLDMVTPDDHGDINNIFKMPKAVWFNDRVAESADEVKGLLRDAADWLESHPLSTLAQVADAPIDYTITEAGLKALVNA